MVQEAGGRADKRPVVVIPAWVYLLILLVVGLSGRALNQNHIQVFLGSSQPFGQNSTVALIHKEQNPSRSAASQVGQQLIDRVALL